MSVRRAPNGDGRNVRKILERKPLIIEGHMSRADFRVPVGEPAAARPVHHRYAGGANLTVESPEVCK